MPLARTPVISIIGWIATTYTKSINRLTLANKLYFRLKYLKYVKLNNNIIKEVVIMVKSSKAEVMCIVFNII